MLCGKKRSVKETVCGFFFLLTMYEECGILTLKWPEIQIFFFLLYLARGKPHRPIGKPVNPTGRPAERGFVKFLETLSLINM